MFWPVLLMVGMMTSTPQAGEGPVTTVSSVDLSRYLGVWHELARYPNRFQRQCVADVTARYSQLEDGRIRVVNRCRTEDGRYDEAEGIARVVDKETNARLKVRFAPSWLGFLPFVWGDYWIIGLADDYSYAVVGTPDRKYLWILAREASPQESVWTAAVETVRANGFDESRLVKTPQTVLPKP